MVNRLTDFSNPSALIPADTSDNIFLKLFNNLSDGICIFEIINNKLKALYASQRYFDIVGYTREQFLPFLDNITVPFFEEDEYCFMKMLNASTQNNEIFSINVRAYRFDNTVGLYKIDAVKTDYIRSDNPVFMIIVNDISSEKSLRNQLEVNKAKYKMLAEMSNSYMFIFTPCTDKMELSVDSVDDKLIVDDYSAFLRKSRQTNHDEVMQLFNALMKACRSECKGVMITHTKTIGINDDKFNFCRVKYSSIADEFGTVITVVGQISVYDEDLSAQMINSNKHSVNCLENSRSAIKRISASIAAGGNRGFMIIIDIDNFSEFNKKYGFAVGDNAIEIISSIIANVFSDAVSFLYCGDEFVIYIETLTESQLHDRLDKLLAAVETININGVDMDSPITLSIGAAWTVNDDKAGILDYYITAEKAVYLAKKSGKNCVEVEKIIYR